MSGSIGSLRGAALADKDAGETQFEHREGCFAGRTARTYWVSAEGMQLHAIEHMRIGRVGILFSGARTIAVGIMVAVLHHCRPPPAPHTFCVVPTFDAASG